MKLTEKMSYLKGLLDGLEIDTTTKEGKLLIQMTEVMQEMVNCVEDVEEDLYDFDDCDCDDCCDDDDCDCDDYDLDDDELYEVCCPSCGETVILDEYMLEEGSIDCPNCGENLEFDYFDDVELADAPEDPSED